MSPSQEGDLLFLPVPAFLLHLISCNIATWQTRIASTLAINRFTSVMC